MASNLTTQFAEGFDGKVHATRDGNPYLSTSDSADAWEAGRHYRASLARFVDPDDALQRVRRVWRGRGCTINADVVALHSGRTMRAVWTLQHSKAKPLAINLDVKG